MDRFAAVFRRRRRARGTETIEEQRQEAQELDGRYGQWAGMVRAVAGFDHDKAQRILGWPLSEALEAFEDVLRRDALAQFRHEEQVWALLAPHVPKGSRKRPPERPPILRGNDVARSRR